MKNMFWKKFITVLLIIFSLAGLAEASGSFTVSVSCSIPEIPGLNAPLIEEETTNANTAPSLTQVAVEKKQNTGNEMPKNQPAPATIQEDGQVKAVLAEGEVSRAIVKTAYSR